MEQAGGLGTLVALDDVVCSTGVLPSGTVVWDAERPPPAGAIVRGWGWIRPLGDDEFAAVLLELLAESGRVSVEDAANAAIKVMRRAILRT